MIREALFAALMLLCVLAIAVWVAGRLHRAHVRERAALADQAAKAALAAAGLTMPMTEKLHAEIAAVHVLLHDLRRRQGGRADASPSNDNSTPSPGCPAAPPSDGPGELSRPAGTSSFPPFEDASDEPTRVLERPWSS
jgi:phenylpyruvate tautomerase PptA (4-oxalocrotonate tautomerase family)